MSILLDEFGMVAPSAGGGGGGTYYKCASVDAANHKWSGYLAIVNPVTGAWSFANTATPGLPYDRITPVVGRVYDELASFEVRGYKTGIPERGLKFYLPLDEYPGDYDATGNHVLSYRATDAIRYGQVVQGLAGTAFGYNRNPAAIYGPTFALIIPESQTTELTVSCWMSGTDNFGGMGFSDNWYLTAAKTGVEYNSSKYQCTAGSQSSYRCYSDTLTGVHHVLATYKDDIVKLYIGGAYTAQGSYNESGKVFGGQENYFPAVIGVKSNGGSPAFFKAFRIYDRALSDSEIAALAAEFTPTPAE